jgi:hypothetical protein
VKQAKLRTRVAAALLLSPIAALLAAPAAAQQYVLRVNAPAIAIPAAVIEQFSVRPTGPLEPGRVIRFYVEGTPGSQVTVDIPRIADRLPLRETRQGVYEGRYVMYENQNPYGFSRAVATLRNGPFAVSARAQVHGEGYGYGYGRGSGLRDHTAPQITHMTPSDGERVGERGRTEVSARIHDDRSGIDPSSIRLRIDGQDVTHATAIDHDEVRFRDDLPRGRHVAELMVRDRAGNVATRSWTFVVRDGYEGHGRAWSPAYGRRG